MNFKTRDLILALLCAFLGSIKGLLVSKIKSLGPIEIFGLRSLGATSFIIPIIIFYNYKLWYDYRSNLILLVRSIVGNIAVSSYYFGFAYLPIAEASVLFYSTPVFTIFIGYMFLKEKCGRSEVISVIFSLLGIVLVSFPDFTFDATRNVNNTIKGVAGSIIGAIAQAVALAVVRKITFIPPVVASFWWALVGIPFSAVLSSLQIDRFNSWPCGLETWIIIMIAMVGFVSELCLVAALKSTDAVIVSIALTSEILWAFILQIYVNNEMPNILSVFGGIAIVFSISVPPILNRITLKKKDLLMENMYLEKLIDEENGLQTERFNSWSCGLEAWIIIMIAMVGFVSEPFLVVALKSTDVVIVSISLTSEILWAFILQIYVNNEIKNILSVFGGIAI